MKRKERILREKYISPEQRQKIIDGIRLRWKYIIMEYQKIINLWDNTQNDSSKYRKRNWDGINDEWRGMHDCNSDIKFKTSIIRSNLCDYSDTCIDTIKETITVPNKPAQDAAAYNTNKKVIFKRPLFTKCVIKINNTQLGDAQGIDIVMPMYNLIEYSDAYLKISGYSWQYYRDEPSLDNNRNIIDFPTNNKGILSRFKQQITG